MNPQTDSFTIIGRVLQFGNREELRWLFTTYSREKNTSWLGQAFREKIDAHNLTVDFGKSYWKSRQE